MQMPYQNCFRLKSPLAQVQRQAFPVSSRHMLDFEDAADNVVMGEWMTLSSTYLLTRAADNGTPPGPWVVFDELGRGDTQAIAAGKLTVLFGGMFWGETKIFVGAPTLGSALCTRTGVVTGFGTATRTGIGNTGGGSPVTIGYVTKLAADNGGWLQFQTCLY
jgi:hypothetical protein